MTDKERVTKMRDEIIASITALSPNAHKNFDDAIECALYLHGMEEYRGDWHKQRDILFTAVIWLELHKNDPT